MQLVERFLRQQIRSGVRAKFCVGKNLLRPTAAPVKIPAEHYREVQVPKKIACRFQSVRASMSDTRIDLR